MPNNPVRADGNRAPVVALAYGAEGADAQFVTPTAGLPIAPPADQDPIFDHANGAKVTVTTSATDIVTPPAGCKYLRISGDADVFIRTDGSAAVDDGHCIRLVKDVPETIPVTAGTKVSGITATGTATVRATPLKSR